MDLDAAEVRVLGCLIEKQRTTPDVYPLSLNGLRAACNQSTNRDPIVSYDDDVLREALHRLGRRGWTRLASGARAPKYRHLLDEKPGLARDEQAVLAVLMLRGPQTLGELRTRTERMQPFADTAELQSVLGRLAERGFAELQPRRPGQKEQRYAHLLSSDLDEDDVRPVPAPAPAATSTPPSQQAPRPEPVQDDPLVERVDRLEADLAALAQQVAQLRAALGE
jgi:uncharacterized protein YceH (UPF0502 family)